MAEAPDPSMNLHQLTVCRAPDVWIVNLLTRQGQHIVDPGPNIDVHMPVLNEPY